jgi:hypothetical protein
VGVGCAGWLVAGELPGAWRHWSHFRSIEIESSGASAGLVRVPVPHELFAEARTDLHDIRVIDGAGTEIGWVVFAPGERRGTQWRDAGASEQGFVPGEYSQLVLDTGEGGALHDAVRLAPDGTGDLFVWVEVAASAAGPPDAGAAWRIVRRRAPLYRLEGRPSEPGLTLRYARTRDRWLRLRFLDPEHEITVSRARVGELLDEPAELEPFPARLVPDPSAPDGESWYRPPGEVTRLPIAALAVRTARDAFHRPVEVRVSDDRKTWRTVGSGQVYRYGPFTREASAAATTADPGTGVPAHGDHDLSQLQVTFEESAAPWWRVVVIDRDDPPIPDLEVELLVRRRQIVFRPSGTAPYRILYGNPRAEAPGYELAHLASREALAGASPAHLGPEETNESWRSAEPFTERHPILLWLALGVAILALAALALRTLRS